jgi:hypothetical protein
MRKALATVREPRLFVLDIFLQVEEGVRLLEFSSNLPTTNFETLAWLASRAQMLETPDLVGTGNRGR